jgi:hypothetical protein
MSGKMLTLRIKKHWFEEIAAERKRVEYRANTPYNTARVARGRPALLRLHYQGERELLAVIEEIALRKTPSELLGDLGTELCYAIRVRDPIVIRKLIALKQGDAHGCDPA